MQRENEANGNNVLTLSESVPGLNIGHNSNSIISSSSSNSNSNNINSIGSNSATSVSRLKRHLSLLLTINIVVILFIGAQQQQQLQQLQLQHRHRWMWKKRHTKMWHNFLCLWIGCDKKNRRKKERMVLYIDPDDQFQTVSKKFLQNGKCFFTCKALSKHSHFFCNDVFWFGCAF